MKFAPSLLYLPAAPSFARNSSFIVSPMDFEIKLYLGSKILWDFLQYKIKLSKLSEPPFFLGKI
jgi:hypothetical protein